jgi:NADPH:quinone reductase-like Zn-dependent oxidoreductase
LSRAWIPSREGVHTIEAPAPSPEPHEVVIAVEAAQLSRAQPHRHLAVPGQSAVGRVVAAGEHALALLDQRVLVGSIDPCGQCEVCRRGGGTVCPHAHQRGSDAAGTLAERITVAAKWVVPLGGELGLDGPASGARQDLDNDGAARPAPGQKTGKEAKAPPRLPQDPCALAAVAGDAVLAYTVYARSDLAPREPVVLFGCAPVTRFLVEILLAKGLQPVVLLERLLDEHGYDRSDGAWRAWLEERQVQVVEHDDSSDIDELREAITAALGPRESASGGPATAPDAAKATLAGRPWKLLATQPHCLWLATRLAGPRAVVTAVVPPVLRDGSDLLENYVDQPHADSPDHLMHAMLLQSEREATQGAFELTRGTEIDPKAWTREVSLLSVTAASPELILETAALVARGLLDLDEGVAVVDLGDLAPDSIAALGASRALVVRVPQARS